MNGYPQTDDHCKFVGERLGGMKENVIRKGGQVIAHVDVDDGGEVRGMCTEHTRYTRMAASQ